MNSQTLSVYVSRAGDKDLYEHIEKLQEENKSVSAFFKDAANAYLANNEMDLDDRIRHIIETEYIDKISVDKEPNLDNRVASLVNQGYAD